MGTELASTPCYAVIDLETTGLDPASSRIVECAVLAMSSTGTIDSEWSSLIGIPGASEPGAQELHGISKAMLEDAPRFSDVSGELVARLRGRVVVGHVLEFDLSHLRAEFARGGYDLPELENAGICTRDWARVHLQGPSYALTACCERAGVRQQGVHTALGDARATAGLLTVLLDRAARTELVAPGSNGDDVDVLELDVNKLSSAAQRVQACSLAALIARVRTTPRPIRTSIEIRDGQVRRGLN